MRFGVLATWHSQTAGMGKHALTGLALAALLALASTAQAQHRIGEIFQAHDPDGNAYWVVECAGVDDCYEAAFQHCNGPYTPLEARFSHNFRFVCGKTDKPKATAPGGS
jgi:hypothetical protein